MLALLHHVFDFFYPNLCLVCEREQPLPDRSVCVACQVKLPKTGFHQDRDNAFEQRFWNRQRIVAGTSMYYFFKGSSTQALIHKLKYKGQRVIGYQLGKLYGYDLKESREFADVEVIVPVPLHPMKERRRGYNQSDCFAEGLSESMGIPWLKGGLKRVHNNSSQTRKSQLGRFEDTLNNFRVNQPKALQDKHVLLVDDVLTTGATLEACAQHLLELPNTRVSMATIAIAQH